jgi:hypothetical protein
MQNEIKTRVRLEVSDYRKFSYRVLQKKFLPLFIFMAAIFLLPVLLLVLIDPFSPFTGMPAYSSVPPLIFLFVIPSLIFISTYFSSKNSFENNKLLQKERVCIFNASGIETTANDSHVKISWSDIYKYDTAGSNILIYTSPVMALIYPKRFFSPAEIEALSVLLKTHVVPKKKTISVRWIIRIAIVIIGLLYILFKVFRTH